MIRTILARGGETLLAVGLALAFFLTFMGLLSLVFPAGTSLADLMRSGEPIGGLAADGGGRPEIETAATTPGDSIAVLSRVRRNVKDRPADAIAWSDARAGLRLGNYHSVQTYDRSQATIRFAEAGDMTLGENTLVILKSAERLDADSRSRASLLVLGGTLRGRIAVGRAEAMTIEIEAATKAARLRSNTAPGQATEFSVKVHDDHSSSFTVLAGKAQVVAAGGAVTVAPSHAVTVDAQGAIGPIVALPPAPEPDAPAPAARQRFHSSRARIEFRWSLPAGTDAAVITVARDAALRDVIAEERVAGTAYTLGNLRPGRYHWRVRSLRGDLEGGASAVRDFTLVQDRRPPALTVAFPQGSVDRSEVELTGTTEPGTKVYVGGEAAQIDAAGRFTYRLRLKRGVNIVVVEAEDDTGNVAYRSHIINASY
jgi:Glucodextranase, domain B